MADGPSTTAHNRLVFDQPDHVVFVGRYLMDDAIVGLEYVGAGGVVMQCMIRSSRFEGLVSSFYGHGLS